MRFDFRVKVDLTEINKEPQQHSWVFVDSTKIFLIKDLENHIRQLFKISGPFQLFSKSEGELYTLPSIEDVRVLQNNDTISVIPGAGPEEPVTGTQYDFQDRSKEKKVLTLDDLVQKYVNKSEKPKEKKAKTLDELGFQEYANNSEKPKEKKAMTLEGFDLQEYFNKSEKPKEKKAMTLDELVQEYVDKSEIEENKPKDSSDTVLDDMMFSTAVFDSSVNTSVDQTYDEFAEPSNTKKRKRTRRKDKNKKVKNSSDCEMSLIDTCPQPVTNIIHSSVKHIRFGEEVDDSVNQVEDLEKFLKYEQTPPLPKLEGQKKSEETSSEIGLNECVAFKILKLDNSTPTISKEITARILDIDEEKSKYTMKILYGQDHLKMSIDKFALPSEEEKQDYADEVVTFEKSQLIDLRKLC